MAKGKIGLKFEGWEELIGKLDKLGGGEVVKKAVSDALNKSKDYVTPKLEEAVSNGNLPAKGKYSTGRTKRSLDKKSKTEWEGMTGSINVGFNFKESGTVSIFLMYGTPRMKPATGLKSAIYGNSTKKMIVNIQSDVINKRIKEIMEGGNG